MVASRRTRFRRFFVSLVRVSAAVYLTLLLGLYLMESRLMYPAAYQPALPIAAAVDSESWTYTTTDGIELTGRIKLRPGSRRAVLFLHGNATRADRQDRWINRIAETLDASVCAAEYRGFQYQDITPHESNLIEDSLAAHRAVCERFELSPNEVIVWGRSLGGGCAAAVAQRYAPDILILERTFDSAASVAASRYPMFPIRMLMRNVFDSTARLKNFRGHLIQLHGTDDRVIPIDHGRWLHAAIPSTTKAFLELPGLGHNDPIDTAALRRVRQLADANGAP